MSKRWIRVDTTWSQSEWLAELEPECRLVWIELLCHAKAHGTDGVVKASYVALQRVTGVTRNGVHKLVTAAIEHGSVTVEGSCWVITGWREYQGDTTAAKRMKAYRQRQQQDTEAEPLRPLRVTHRNDTPVTPTETETETIKTDMSDPGFDELWKLHARGPKAKAKEAYRKALKETDHETIMTALRAYVRSFRGDWKGAHLFRWLTDARWEEAQAPEARSDYRPASEVLW
jgi:hypothetical protein